MNSKNSLVFRLLLLVAVLSASISGHGVNILIKILFEFMKKIEKFFI